MDSEKGFRKAIDEFNLQVKEKWIFRDPYSIECGKRVLREIRAMEDRPTAIFTGSDEICCWNH